MPAEEAVVLNRRSFLTLLATPVVVSITAMLAVAWFRLSRASTGAMGRNQTLPGQGAF